MSGIPCPDCVDESNYQVWSRYLSKQIDKLLCAETMQTEVLGVCFLQVYVQSFGYIVYLRAFHTASSSSHLGCFIQLFLMGKLFFLVSTNRLQLFLELFQQVVTFFPDDKDDFMYMLRLLERWEKKSIPAVLAKGRPDAAYAIAMGLCEHLPLLIYREDIRDYLNEYKLRIGKLIYASFAALVDSVATWNNEEKREEAFTYIFTHLSRFDDFKRVQNNIQMLAPSKKFTGEPVKIEREMNDEEERAAREAERRRREKERQILEAEKEAKSLIPLNKDYEQNIFNRKNVDWDCYSIWQLMLEENKNIEKLLAVGEYRAAALMFLQLTKSMCRHFVIDRHWEYFDDMYSPEYAIRDLTEEFEKLAKEGKLPEDVNAYLHEAWKEIEGMESCTDYGVPRGALPF